MFPNGYSRFGGILATWNAGSCCGGAVRNNIDDVGFIREVIARMERQASVDPGRIFATGMSNGAMMSWRLACELSEIRAIAPVAGTDNTPACKPSRPVPVIEFHALDDNLRAVQRRKGRPVHRPSRFHLGAGDAGEMGAAQSRAIQRQRGS